MDALRLEHVSHAYGDLLAVEDLSLGVQAGELVCLLGPSGCGKTTALRVAAGLERLQRGRVVLDGQVVAGEKRDLPPEARSADAVSEETKPDPYAAAAMTNGAQEPAKEYPKGHQDG